MQSTFFTTRTHGTRRFIGKPCFETFFGTSANFEITFDMHF